MHIPEPRKSVLVVDSDNDTRNHLLKLIESLGFDAIAASNGPDALNMIESHREHQDPFAFILIEIYMPGTDGVEVVEMLRHDKDETPVIFMTQDFDERGHYSREVLKTFSPHFLPKPLTDLPLIRMTIAEALSAAATDGQRN